MKHKSARAHNLCEGCELVSDSEEWTGNNLFVENVDLDCSEDHVELNCMNLNYELDLGCPGFLGCRSESKSSKKIRPGCSVVRVELMNSTKMN